jgi:UDP-2,4-diacetamido-2,4,6-trideoxy-beta-L-altropyranose hydrolase
MTSRIAFLVEGSLEMGMGHIYRTITLAEELGDRAKTWFLTKSDEIVINQIENAGFSVLTPKNDDEVVDLLQETKPDIIIVDRLDITEDFAKELKETLKAKLVLFENLSTASKYADVVVNAIMGSEFNNRKFLDRNTNTLYFYGPKYLMFRKEFYEFRRQGKGLSDEVEKVLLIFGGSDPSNLTSIVLDELLSLNNDFKIDVILGAHFGYFDELNWVLVQHQDKKENVNQYRNIKNVAELMYKADLVIASPGLSVFEALCVGTPVVIIHQNLWQKKGFEGFAETLAKSEVNRLKDIIASGDFLNPHHGYIKRLNIGEGKPELIKAIIGG